jgi:hypothetical protein
MTWTAHSGASIKTGILTEYENRRALIIKRRYRNIQPPVRLLKHKSAVPGPHLHPHPSSSDSRFYAHPIRPIESPLASREEEA